MKKVKSNDNIFLHNQNKITYARSYINRINTIILPIRDKISLPVKDYLIRVKDRINKNGAQELFYEIGGILTSFSIYLLLIFFLFLIISSMFFPVFQASNTFISIFITGLISFLIASVFNGIGLSIEAISKVRLIWNTKIGKWIIGFLGTIVGILGTCEAQKYINYLVGVNPSSFLTATSIFAIPFSIFIGYKYLFILANVVYAIYMANTFIEQARKNIINEFLNIRNSYIFRQLFKMDKLPSPQKTKDFKTMVLNRDFLRWGGSAGLVFILLFPLMAFSYLETSSPLVLKKYFHATKLSLGPELLVQLEFHQRSLCNNIAFGEKVAFLDGDYISVAMLDKKYGYRFEVRQCDLPNSLK